MIHATRDSLIGNPHSIIAFRFQRGGLPLREANTGREGAKLTERLPSLGAVADGLADMGRVLNFSIKLPLVMPEVKLMLVRPEIPEGFTMLFCCISPT